MHIKTYCDVYLWQWGLQHFNEEEPFYKKCIRPKYFESRNTCMNITPPQTHTYTVSPRSPASCLLTDALSDAA
ncbi:hypothetical protein FKM82_011825 [Ascaphus truei]